MGLTLVVGATGQQGRAVAWHLGATDQPVRAMIRDPSSAAAAALAEQGCDLHVADLDRPETLEAAFDGVDRAFLFLPLGDEQSEYRRGVAVIDAARRQGISHLVYSSALDTDRPTGVPHFDSKFRLRQHLLGSDLPWTVLEPGGFMENLCYPQTWKGIFKGRLVTPFDPQVIQPLVAVDDIGRFAAHCLASGPQAWAGRTVPLYSECLSGAEQAEIIGECLARSVSAGRLPWLLTRLLLGRDLTRMFDFVNAGRAAPPPGNEHFSHALGEPMSFRAWFSRQLESHER